MGRKISTSVDGLGPTPEQAAKGGIVTELRQDGDWRRNVRGCRSLRTWPVDRLLRRGALTERQHKAASWYREQWERAGLAARVTSSWEMPVDVSGWGREPGLPATDAQMSARRRWLAAREGVPLQLRGPFEAVVLGEVSDMAEAGAGCGYSDRKRQSTAGMVVVRLACDIVGDHLRLPAAKNEKRKAAGGVASR